MTGYDWANMPVGTEIMLIVQDGTYVVDPEGPKPVEAEEESNV